MRIPSVLAIALLISSVVLILPSSRTSEATITPYGSSLNGNQELVADPTRPLVYAADTDGEKVHILNATSGTELWNVSVGTSPLSLDVSSDGRYLYVAVSADNSIGVVDLQNRIVSRTIPLNFTPLSMRIGLSGRLYLTDIPGPYDTGKIIVIDEASGTFLQVVGGFGDCILEMSPNKTVLLMMQLGTSPTPLYKYSCADPKLVLLDQDNHDLGDNPRQIVVDWENERIYLACGWPYGIEVISLATMDKLGMMSAEPYPSGVALSPDHKTVLCTTMGAKDQLWAFYTSNGTLMAKYRLRESSLAIDPSTYAAIAAPPCADSIVAIGKPVKFLNLSRPVLFPGFPRANENVGYSYSDNIRADIFMGVPPCNITSCLMQLNGKTLQSHVENHALVGMLPEQITEGGNHTIYAFIGWDEGSADISWTFSTSENEHIVSTTPGMWSEINYVPDNILVVLDLGYPERTRTSDYVGLNGMLAPYDFDSDIITIHTQYQGMSLVLPGLNEVALDIGFVYVDYMTPIYTSISLTWIFFIKNATASPSFEELAWHNLSNGVSMKLPVSWTISDDVNVSGVFFDTQALGPIIDNKRSVITLQSGIDHSITEDEQYLDSFADEFVTKMQELNNPVYIVEGPSQREISEHPGVVFAARWTNQPLVQKMAVVVDQSSGEYWILIMTAEASRYFDQNPMFEGVISSFSPPTTEGLSERVQEAIRIALMVVLAVAVAVLVAMVIVALGIWERFKIPPTK